MEILLVASVPFVFRLRVLRQFSTSPIFAPLVLWFLWAGTRLAFSVPQYGMTAVRDGLPVLESVFLVLGFAMASQRDVMKTFIKYLPFLIAAIVAYTLLAPFRHQLMAISQTLPSSQGKPVPIFFTYTNTASLLLACSAYFWVKGSQKRGLFVWLPALCIGLGLVLFPSRSFLIQVIVLIGVLSLAPSRRRFEALVSIFGMGLLVVLGIFLISYMVEKSEE